MIITVYYKHYFFLKMYRLLNIQCSRIPNALFKKGNLVAVQDIRRGDCIRVPMPRKIKRTRKERKELDRLAGVSYSHAINN